MEHLTLKIEAKQPRSKAKRIKELAEDLARVLAPSLDEETARKNAEPRFTTHGTRCAKSWDEPWIARVEQTEQQLGHPICGARTIDGDPCELTSNHENGRCRFHGGFALTGAPKGNRNAVIHGLYSRRLKRCSATCPQWKECPCAGPDIQALPEPKRPICPYEQTLYNTALTDAQARISRNPHSDPFDLHIAHNLALTQVMLNRAALAMRDAPIVDTVLAKTDAYTMESSKPSAYLQAFNRIANDLRRFAGMLRTPNPQEPDLNEYMRHMGRMMADTDLTADRAHLLHTAPASGVDQARRYTREAVQHAVQGNEALALDAFGNAIQIAPNHASTWDQKIARSYRPRGMMLPPRAVKKLFREITEKDLPDVYAGSHIQKRLRQYSESTDL